MDEPVKHTPVDIGTTTTFHKQGTVMEVKTEDGRTLWYQLTPKGWQQIRQPKEEEK